MGTPLSLKILLVLNRLFKLPVHPFNLSAGGGLTYAEWQFEKGAQTIAFFLDYTTADEMFRGKTVLDVGCGAAGKSLYYASLGARSVVGLDVVERYREEALELAKSKGLTDRFTYVCADAANTGFADGSFDAVILNDAVEHLPEPGAALRECLRLLKPGGKVYLNFPPYYHPYGAHLSDAISIPWAHALFSEKTLIAAYKILVAGQPDAAERLSLRISRRDASGEGDTSRSGAGGTKSGMDRESVDEGKGDDRSDTDRVCDDATDGRDGSGSEVDGLGEYESKSGGGVSGMKEATAEMGKTGEADVSIEEDIGSRGDASRSGAGSMKEATAEMGKTGEEYLSYINHMTIRRFRKIMKTLPAKCLYYKETPLRGFLRPLAAIPRVKEFFVKMTASVLAPDIE